MSFAHRNRWMISEKLIYNNYCKSIYIYIQFHFITLLCKLVVKHIIKEDNSILRTSLSSRNKRKAPSPPSFAPIFIPNLEIIKKYMMWISILTKPVKHGYKTKKRQVTDVTYIHHNIIISSFLIYQYGNYTSFLPTKWPCVHFPPPIPILVLFRELTHPITHPMHLEQYQYM